MRQESSMTIYSGKQVAITGITGPLGSALARRLLSGDDAPSRLVGISRKWQDQERLERELGNDPRLRMFIGDVRDYSRLVMAFRNIDFVIHTAAIKGIVQAQ